VLKWNKRVQGKCEGLKSNSINGYERENMNVLGSLTCTFSHLLFYPLALLNFPMAAPSMLLKQTVSASVVNSDNIASEI